ncbi:MAG TPA: HAD family hydrolase [Gaiellaceae bacterium]|nr:HAD family hydrolase [Gaiellaceae bacterium]
MLEAVLFDWGDTLMRWAFDAELLAAGHVAGLAAIGRPADPELTARFRDAYLPKFFEPGVIEEVEYPAEIRRLLAEFGIEPGDDELLRFLEAEHAAWAPARQLASTTHALLESLRDRGLKLGLVSNAIDPPDLLHRDLADLGVAERLDVAVFSSEVGRRKPDAAIFERALDALGVAPERALFVGDRLEADVGGAAALGMATCQALWFVADEDEEPEPDFRAFTQVDVLTAVKRLGVAVSPA